MVGQVLKKQAPEDWGAQFFETTRKIAVDPNAPPEIRALGEALNRLLSGSREVDLSALPEELAALVRGIMEE